MCQRRRIVAAALVAAITILGGTKWASAQSFEERWSPVPKAHADTNPPPPPNYNFYKFPPRLDAPLEPGTRDSKSSPSRHTNPTPNASIARQSRSLVANSPHQGHARKNVIVGRASYYAYRGGKTASGASFRANAMTAAHRTLPFGTRLRVTDVKTRKSIEVVVTDRGPAIRSRVLDLSLAAAKALGVGDRGIIYVRAELVRG
jgi:rare lipoprotein A